MAAAVTVNVNWCVHRWRKRPNRSFITHCILVANKVKELIYDVLAIKLLHMLHTLMVSSYNQGRTTVSMGQKPRLPWSNRVLQWVLRKRSVCQ
jgi:hypothetical protein